MLNGLSLSSLSNGLSIVSKTFLIDSYTFFGITSYDSFEETSIYSIPSRRDISSKSSLCIVFISFSLILFSLSYTNSENLSVVDLISLPLSLILDTLDNILLFDIILIKEANDLLS